MCKLSQTSPMGAPSSWLLCPFDLWALNFWHNKIASSSSCASWLQPWNQPFLLEPLIPFIGKWYLQNKMGGPGVLFTTRVSLFLRHSADRARRYLRMHIHTHTYILIHLYLFLYMSICIYIKIPWGHRDTTCFNQTPPHCSLPPFLTGSSLLWKWET